MFKSRANCSCSVLLIALSGTAGTGRATTIRVPEDQPTIQQAIDVAADGDSIDVAPGVYVPPYTVTINQFRCGLWVHKDVTLMAQELYQAILDGQGEDRTLVCIQASPHIEGFVLQNAGRSGIEQAQNSGSWSARNLIVRNVRFGIMINQSASRTGSGTVANVVIDGCTNDGFATNDANSLDVRNSVVMNCDTAFRGWNHNSFTASYTVLFNNGAIYAGDVSFGPNVIEADPLFVSADIQADGYVFPYFPTCASPLVDAGGPDSSFYDVSFPVSLGTQRNDIGAYGGPGATIELTEHGRQAILDPK